MQSMNVYQLGYIDCFDNKTMAWACASICLNDLVEYKTMSVDIECVRLLSLAKVDVICFFLSHDAKSLF